VCTPPSARGAVRFTLFDDAGLRAGMDGRKGSSHGPADGLHGVEACLQGMEGEEARRQVISKTRTKAKVVRKAAKKARKQKRASVVIKGLNGRIQEQRSYPRSRSKAK
jgi:hypothetical protein